MGKIANWTLGIAVSLTALAASGCDDGPVGKAINCGQICDKFETCLSNVDEAKCRENCRDDASKDDAAQCADCLDGDSCSECSVKCSGVGLSLLFSK